MAALLDDSLVIVLAGGMANACSCSPRNEPNPPVPSAVPTASSTLPEQPYQLSLRRIYIATQQVVSSLNRHI